MPGPATRNVSWQERLPLVLAGVVVAGGLVVVIGSALQRDAEPAEEQASAAAEAPESQLAPPKELPSEVPDPKPDDDSELRRVLGQAKMHLAANDLAAARKSIEEAAEVDEASWEVDMLRGVVAAKAGQHKEALEHYERAERTAPRQPDLAQSRGISLRRLGRTEEAYALFSQVIAWDPEFAEAYLQRGLIEARREKFEEAAGDFSRYIGLRPDSPAGYRNRAAALAALGKEGESKRDEMRARELQALNQER